MGRQLQPHELAERLRAIDYPVVNDRVESIRLGDLLRRLGRVSANLSGKRYSENEHGYASVDPVERGLARDAASFVVGAEVTFHSPDGAETPLGDIRYVDEARTKATPSVQTGEGQTEPLLPGHEAWDAVVGTVTHAVEQAWIERFGAEGPS